MGAAVFAGADVAAAGRFEDGRCVGSVVRVFAAPAVTGLGAGSNLRAGFFAGEVALAVFFAAFEAGAAGGAASGASGTITRFLDAISTIVRPSNLSFDFTAV